MSRDLHSPDLAPDRSLPASPSSLHRVHPSIDLNLMLQSIMVRRRRAKGICSI